MNSQYHCHSMHLSLIIKVKLITINKSNSNFCLWYHKPFFCFHKIWNCLVFFFPGSFPFFCQNYVFVPFSNSSKASLGLSSPKLPQPVLLGHYLSNYLSTTSCNSNTSIYSSSLYHSHSYHTFTLAFLPLYCLFVQGPWDSRPCEMFSLLWYLIYIYFSF